MDLFKCMYLSCPKDKQYGPKISLNLKYDRYLRQGVKKSKMGMHSVWEGHPFSPLYQ